MKKILFTIILISILQGTAYCDQYINGYYRQNGTYVQPYYKTVSDQNVYNNYSTKGNYNPYTGKEGYVMPTQQQCFNSNSNTHYNNYYKNSFGN